MAGLTDPGRDLERDARWFMADIVLAALFLWITVVSLKSDAFVAENGAVEGAEWVLALSPILLLPIRRLAPATTFALATVLYLAISLSLGDSNAPLAAPFFTYTVGLTRPRTESAAMVFTAASVLSIATFFGAGDPEPLTAVVWFLLFGGGWAVAASIRQHRSRAERLRLEVSQLEAHQAEAARTAIAAERARIARELHDAVGHAVNVIVLQAGAARLTGDPDQALVALREIENVGRGALIDLDHLLGLLDGTEEAAKTPSRNVDDIIALVDELRGAGADITLDNQCHGKLDWRTGAAAFRIAQEALTNAVKHAGQARIDITMSCTERDFRLVVSDNGSGSDTAPSRAGGRGIPGMTERANVLGGRLTAGPSAAGGFVVEATLPNTPDTTRNQVDA